MSASESQRQQSKEHDHGAKKSIGNETYRRRAIPPEWSSVIKLQIHFHRIISSALSLSPTIILTILAFFALSYLSSTTIRNIAMAAIAEQIQNLTMQGSKTAVAETQSIEHIKNPIVQEVEIAGSETDSVETASVKSHDEFAGFHSSSDSELDVFFKLASGPFRLAMAKIGVDLDIFSILNKSEKPLSLVDLAEKSGAAPALLGHILRTLSSFGMVKETSKDEFVANHITTLLTDINLAESITYVFDSLNQINQALPAFLKDRKYQNVTSGDDTAFQRAFDTKLGAFEWMSQHSDQMKSLGHLMALQRGNDWVDSYPVEQEVGSFATPEQAILVDVGGGFGQQAISFQRKFPTLPGRIVVQDIPSTLAGAQPVPGIEFQEHDFFQPQPVKGAKFYYLRHVLHNWTEADSIKILQTTIPALGPDSRIVIDEVVLPDVNVPWQSAYLDITMMASFGAVERTKTEWESLIDQAGLKIVEIHQYDAHKMQAVIIAVPK